MVNLPLIGEQKIKNCHFPAYKTKKLVWRIVKWNG